MDEVEQILARTSNGGGGGGGGEIPLPADGQDMETFVFAMLYEDEPKSLF